MGNLERASSEINLSHEKALEELTNLATIGASTLDELDSKVEELGTIGMQIVLVNNFLIRLNTRKLTFEDIDPLFEALNNLSPTHSEVCQKLQKSLENFDSDSTNILPDSPQIAELLSKILRRLICNEKQRFCETSTTIVQAIEVLDNLLDRGLTWKKLSKVDHLNSEIDQFIRLAKQGLHKLELLLNDQKNWNARLSSLVLNIRSKLVDTLSNRPL